MLKTLKEFQLNAVDDDDDDGVPRAPNPAEKFMVGQGDMSEEMKLIRWRE